VLVALLCSRRKNNPPHPIFLIFGFMLVYWPIRHLFLLYGTDHSNNRLPKYKLVDNMWTQRKKLFMNKFFVIGVMTLSIAACGGKTQPTGAASEKNSTKKETSMPAIHPYRKFHSTL
jgi:hypothetical protein